MRFLTYNLQVTKCLPDTKYKQNPILRPKGTPYHMILSDAYTKRLEFHQVAVLDMHHKNGGAFVIHLYLC